MLWVIWDHVRYHEQVNDFGGQSRKTYKMQPKELQASSVIFGRHSWKR